MDTATNKKKFQRQIVFTRQKRLSQHAPDNLGGAESAADRGLLDEVCNLVLNVNELREGGGGGGG
jgi:hypothetical protein